MVIPINVFWRINGSGGVFHMAMISLPSAFGFHSYWGENTPAFLTFLMALPFSKLSLNTREQTFLLLLFKLLAVKIKIVEEIPLPHETISVIVYLLQLELSVLYHKYDHNLLASSPGKYQLLAGFLILLAQYHHTQHHIPFYADKLQINAEYLSKTVKKVTGRSAKYFIKQAIVKEAMILLQGSPDIADIGRKVGFEDPSSFSRFFKRLTSMSPRAFRKNLNPKEKP
jgi:YesN/AraC family two-component response regulator